MNISRRKLTASVLMVIAIGLVIYAGVWAWRVRIESTAQYHRMQVVREMLASDEVAIIIMTPDDRICEWSPGATRLFGWTEKEVLGSEPSFLMSKKSWEAHQAAFAAHTKIAHTDKMIIAHDCYAFAKDGSVVPAHFIVAPFKDNVGYYHLAIMSKEVDFKRLNVVTKPTPGEVPPLPAPQPLPPLPGIYHPFQNNE